MIGIKFKDYIQCNFCDNPFEKGTGHLCYCADCDSKGLPSKHPMCPKCYEEAKQKGDIKDTHYGKTNMDQDLLKRLI